MADQKKDQSNSNSTLFKIVLPVAAVLLLATAALNFYMVSRGNEQHVVQMADQVVTSRADAVDAVINQLRSQQEFYARSPEVVRLLEENDAFGIESFGEKYLMSFNSAERANLIPVGGQDNFNLRFAEIDMVRKVEAGQAVLPEAYVAEGKKFVNMITEVKSPSGSLLGSLLVTYSLKPIETAMHQKQEDGRIALMQQFEGAAAMEVVGVGTAGTSGEQASGATSIPHWKITFAPSDAYAKKEVSSALNIAVVQAAAILLCILLLAVYQWRRSKGLVYEPSILETPIQIKGARKIDKASKIEQSTATEGNVGLVDPLFEKTDVLDLDSDDEFDIKPSAAVPSEKPVTKAKAENFPAPPAIFRDYDIRGHADRDISDELARRIGQAFGSECIEQGQERVVLAGDGRKSTPRLLAAVRDGLVNSGCDVIDLGNVPTPLMYFATHTMNTQSGIMVTASHNPAADNGFKMVIKGVTLFGDKVQRIRDRVRSGDFTSGAGSVSENAIVDSYIDHIVGDVALAGSYRVVIDCGNGIAGVVAPKLFEELGCEVIPMYCDVDGAFPNHAPDPSVMSNLEDLVARVQSEGADMGVALDGDGDRLAIVTAAGTIILPDVLLMLFAKDIVSRNPGTDVIFDVKSTRRLNSLVSSYGGRPVMWKSGHSHIKNKMQETGALIGGELSGHIFFKERWFGFDDGMYSAARLLEIMSIRDQDLDGIFAAFPSCASTPEIRIPVDESKKFSIIKQLSERGEWGNGKLVTIDGVRVDFAKGWGLVRASNTAAELTLRFEADDEESLSTVKHVFKQQLQLIDKALNIPV